MKSLYTPPSILRVGQTKLRHYPGPHNNKDGIPWTLDEDWMLFVNRELEDILKRHLKIIFELTRLVFND